MKRIKKIAVETLLLLSFGIFANSGTASAAPDSLVVSTPDSIAISTPEIVFDLPKTPFIDRIAVKTNAFDWMLTVPNIGIEMDLNGSEFNSFTLGLSAKYNWNTYHYNSNSGATYAPPTTFNLFDIRPEAKYWYRTRKGKTTKENWSVENILKNKKNPKTWRAHYIGAYTNYASYSFKLGQKGRQGHVFGLGATAGYSIPMYEYSNGAIDVELGVSAGVQLCTREMYAHNPDGYFYSRVIEGSKGLHMTPFPVVSDVKVAFVWRHKSIKDKVKEDVEKNRVINAFKTIEQSFTFEAETKEWYDGTLRDIYTSREREKIMANDSLYFDGYMKYIKEAEAKHIENVPSAFSEEFKQDPRVHAIVKEYEQELYKLIEKRKKAAVKTFEKEWSKEKAERAATAKKAEKAAAAEKPKEGKSDKKAKADSSEKTDKAEKPKEVKADKKAKADNSEKPDKAKKEKVEKVEKSEKADKAEKEGKSKKEKTEKKSKEKETSDNE